MNYGTMQEGALASLLADRMKACEEIKKLNLNLNMTRGKPSSEQLDLSSGMLKISNFETADGTDCRNYGLLDGIPEVKRLFAELLEVTPEEIFVGGNSSLNLMYDTVMRAYCFGILGEKPWSAYPRVRFLCPSPGYDRHFAICEQFGIQMIPVSMNEDGPDMKTVEHLVSQDETVKGIWCVPKYSNPQGITYSDEVVMRFASLKPKAKDFRIFWDNAYCVHHVFQPHDVLMNIMEVCKKAGTQDMVLEFASTSKITYSGGGVAVVAASRRNIEELNRMAAVQTIGHDKMNQLRHALFFRDAEGIRKHMKAHAAILRPKFEVVLTMLREELSGKGVGSWSEPNGGYFISYDALPGCAKRIVSLAKEMGVQLTGAGATFPYGKDPEDKNIRIAPTFPPVSELRKAMQVFCLCVEIASLEKLLSDK